MILEVGLGKLLIFGVVTSELFGDEITVVHGGWTLDVLLLYSIVDPIEAWEDITVCFVTDTDDSECSLDKCPMLTLCIFDD